MGQYVQYIENIGIGFDTRSNEFAQKCQVGHDKMWREEKVGGYQF